MVILKNVDFTFIRLTLDNTTFVEEENMISFLYWFLGIV